MSLNEEQITKLRCDAFAFRCAGQALADQVPREEPAPLSTARDSLMTAFMVNVGLALELLMKAWTARAAEEHPYTHRLTDLYDSLPQQARVDLDLMHATFMDEHKDRDITIGQSFVQGDSPPTHPSKFYDWCLLREVYRLLDEHGLFSRRYAFETYSRSEWQWEINPPLALELIDRLSLVVDQKAA